ncbi:Phytochrome-like protein cph1 [Seminavis robusta]|uniref:histidine kinase n=1 Tax=Seminavis robusta TaxID=568900 RepID=A0A9N8HEW7_9STRA|nr:Phytochrome-like protein cph1 [Seminavis robusta]|eukprot:Sro537_g162360.1 Phytochrome-like protein cph1 (1030) ;mRNA; f:34196-37545
MFISSPEAKILACDSMIRRIPWVRRWGGNKRPSSAISQEEDEIPEPAPATENNRKKPPPFRNHKVVVSSAPSQDQPVAESSSQQQQQTRQPTKQARKQQHSQDQQDQQERIRQQKDVESLIGTPLQDWVPFDLYTKITNEVETMKKAKSTRTFLFYEHRKDAYAISLSTTTRAFENICIEIEEVESTEAAGEFYNTLVSLGRVMEFYADEKVIKNACDTVFKLLEHYDRGMVYRFNDDNSGEVIHEIKKDKVTTSYIGMRFPASDIPLPARKLYIKNGLRYIENVDARDIPIITAEENGQMDLSHCRMRAVSKPHLVYLKNMGIVCSLSVAIVVDGDLWGLLAFHGYSRPFRPSLHQRIACETINSMVSVKVESIMKKAQSVRVIELSEALIKWDPNEDVACNISNLGAALLHILDADVLVARVYDAAKENPQTVVVGDESLVPRDVLWEHFAAKSPREVYATDTRKAITDMGLTMTDCPASGVAYYRDGLVQVMMGRGLRSKDVIWAGNPDEPKLRIGGILCPRNSFDTFMEKARKESRSWSASDIHVFQAFMGRVCERSHKRMMTMLRTGIKDANVKYFNAINRAKENCEFFAQMSHEIRTPFHGVMGCLNILNDSLVEMADEEIQDMINTALSSGNHMINLLNDILSLSKNRHLSNAIADDRMRYSQLADDAVQGLRSLALSKHIEFTCEVIPPENNLIVVTDKTKLFQIISNIVNNAIKFSAGKTVKVQLSLCDSMKDAVEKWAKDSSRYTSTVCNMEEGELFHSVENVKAHLSRSAEDKSGKKWMVLMVADTGCGIRPNELAEMFQPYNQESRGSNRIFQGTGLGLFICVTLCQQLNGFLSCSSAHGNGTAFHIGIPVQVEESQGSDAENPDEANAGLSASIQNRPISIRGPIVVCDDNVVNVKILKRGLQLDLKNHDLGHLEVLTADGGLPVFALYKERHPSLLFIDYHMPDEDGSEATRRIRSYEAEKGLPPAYIIIYTADLTDEATSHLRACGTNEIMEKPPPKGFIASIVKRMVVEADSS